jgi:hypothetical protein
MSAAGRRYFASIGQRLLAALGECEMSGEKCPEFLHARRRGVDTIVEIGGFRLQFVSQTISRRSMPFDLIRG